MSRSIYTILLIALILLPAILATASMADDYEGSAYVGASVTVQASTPTVTFNLYSDEGYTTPTTKITPQSPVYMKISVVGKNPLVEFEITAKLFADNDKTAVGTPPSTTSPETYVTFTIYYDTNNDKWVLQADTGSSNTWNIQLDPAKDQPDPNSSSGDFYVIIVFGMTAREANTGDNAPYADWDIIVNATVANSATGTSSGYGYTVYFYSAIDALASSIDFGTIEAGSSSTIQSVDGNAGNSFQVRVIANGYYSLKATTSNQWNTQDGYTINLVTGSPGQGQFSLQVDSDGDFNTGAVYVTSDVASASAFISNQNPTTEAGATHSVYMKITLGTNIHTGTYQGIVTIHAVDAG